MGKLFEQFLAYYNSASAEQKKADWDELSIFNEFGPQALYMTENSLSYYKMMWQETCGNSGAMFNNEEETYNLAA